IVTKGNSTTQSLSDAFATANQEFGMAERLIGGYDRQNQVPVTKEEEEPFTKEPTKEKNEEAFPTKETSTRATAPIIPHASMIADSVATPRLRPQQLSLLPEIKPIAHERKNEHNRENGTISRHHAQNGHTQNDQSESISQRHAPPPPPPEMDFAKSLPLPTKRRRKYRRSPSLFDALQQKL
ncbi:MAG: hypothetical protein ACPGWR_12695, partial [Ardenticatenaceae bacterium]